MNVIYVIKIIMNVSNVKDVFSCLVQNVLIIITFWKKKPSAQCADFNKYYF